MHDSGLNHTISIRFKEVLDSPSSGPIFTTEPYRFLTGIVWYVSNRVARDGSGNTDLYLDVHIFKMESRTNF